MASMAKRIEVSVFIGVSRGCCGAPPGSHRPVRSNTLRVTIVPGEVER